MRQFPPAINAPSSCSSESPSLRPVSFLAHPLKGSDPPNEHQNLDRLLRRPHHHLPDSHSRHGTKATRQELSHPRFGTGFLRSYPAASPTAMASSSAPPAHGWEINIWPRPGAGLFTEAELAAADQLVQLSGSFGGDEASTSSSSSSSLLSTVNTGPMAWEEEVVVVEDGELDRRARKRYRLLSELYAATGPATGAFLRGETTASGGRKRKRRGEPSGKAAMARYGDQS